MTNPLLDTSSLPRFDEIAPEHVMPAITSLLAEHRRRLDSLLDATPDPDFPSLVHPVEEMEHELTRVWSPVSHLQGVLGTPGWRDAYNDALPLLTEHGTELSQNARLQEAYSKVGERLPKDASDAKRSTVTQALRDFHLAGVDLPDDDKARFKAIMLELARIQTSFEHNVIDASDAWQLVVGDESRLSGLSAEFRERARNEAQRRGLEGFVLTLDFPTYHAVLTHADDRELRETLYRGWVTRASDEGADPKWDNTENIERILALRHEASRLVGFDNYADYSLATKMAGSVEEVTGFLRDLAAKSREAGRTELEELAALAGTTIEPWDASYWLEKLKQDKYSVSNADLRRYFPATRVVAGLFGLAGRLYDVRIEACESVPTWHEEALYYSVSGADGAPIGGFYADLYARQGKRSGAWVDDCVNRKSFNGSSTLPVGFLVCNFTPPNGSGMSLLTHEEIVTLFHEFGHMLHHLLTRVDYPSIAGINGVPWDAVELPSQFMENFAWHYDVLESCSSHVESGEPLPRDLFDRLEQSRHAGAALAMLRQIEFGLFDFRLHAEYDPDEGAAVSDLLASVRGEVALFDYPPYNRMAHNFSHIFAGGYAAGYYSYKWAEVLAADAFEAFREAGIFDAGVAGRFRREILEIGGSRDFMEAYVAFRGRKPTADALLRQFGIAA